MKNAAIVLRGRMDNFNGNEFERALSAFADGGYSADKVFLLPEGEPHEFAQMLIECKNFFDNVLILCAAQKLDARRGESCEILKLSQSSSTVLDCDGKTFFFLPFGEAGEGLVRGEVVPHLDAKYSVRHDRAVFRAVGVPADRLADVLSRVESASGGKLKVHSSVKDGDLRLEILYDSNSPKMVADDVSRIVAEGLNNYLYALDDTPLEKRVCEMLKLRGLRLSIAESFTGGGVASAIVSVPGASDVLFEGIVAYSNEAKQARLGVGRDTLAQQGAVSDETAYQMAVGLLATGNCTVSLSTTGIAGPSSDGTDKPVGLNYMAVGTMESVYVYKYLFRGTREEITRRAIRQALFLLYKHIK